MSLQSVVALNVQQSIRPGECKDTYYSGKENSELQCHATVEDNRFFVNLPAPQSGASNTITFNPNEGVAEVILTLQLSAPTGAGGVPVGNGLALPQGWGYMLLRRIGYRYGSSQLYYISGNQNMIQTLSLAEDSGKQAQIFYLGGQALLTSDDWQDPVKRTAYVYLRLPHSSPAIAGGALPFPSDVLTAPIQIQLDLADFTTVVSAVANTAGAADTIPTVLSQAVVNFAQVTMADSGDLIARKFDMSRHALTIPLPEGWTQEEVQFPVAQGADGSFAISLTGVKAGDLRKLRIWFSLSSDFNNGGVKQPNKSYAPSSVQFAINGLIYFDSRSGSWLLTNLLRRRTAPAVTYTALTAPSAPDNDYTVTPATNPWVEIDLSQPIVLGDTYETALVHGVPIMNSVMNLNGVLPIVGGATYTCHCEYVLNCSWMASRGSAEFVF